MISSTPVKVLLVTGRSDPGGGPEHLWQLALRIRQSAEVYIAAPEEVPYWSRFSAAVDPGRLLKISGRAFRLSTVRSLAAFVRRHGITVVHAHGRAAGAVARIACLLARKPCIYTPHGPLDFRSAKAYPYWAFELLLAGFTKRIIAVSASEAAILRRQLLHSKSIDTILNGVTIPVVEVDRQTPRVPPYRIVHATRFVFQKNSEMVLEILVNLRDRGFEKQFVVDFLGDGPGRSTLAERAARLGLLPMCVFHGAQPSIQPYLLDGFCFLTTSRWEGLPLAVLEALAVGLPVLGTSTAGNIDVICPEVGALFELSESALAADLLVKLSAAPAEWRKKSSAARAMAIADFSAERMARETLAVYRSVAPLAAAAVRMTLPETETNQ